MVTKFINKRTQNIADVKNKMAFGKILENAKHFLADKNNFLLNLILS